MASLSEKDRKRGLVLAMGTLGGLVMLDETILGVSLPAIRSEMGLSPTLTHWIINAYMLTFTCFAAIGGKAIDLFGLRPALIVSASVFAFASLLAGFSNGPELLIGMRIVQGLCAAVMFPMTLAAATLTFDKAERGRAIGILAGMATIFLAAGPLLGGVLTDFLSWRWVFWINIPIVAVGTVLACLFWQPPQQTPSRPLIDRIGLLLLLVGMTGIIFGLMEGPDFGWMTPLILCSLLAGIAGIVFFATYEARQRMPLIEVHLFRLKAFHASVLVILLTQMNKIVVAIFVPHFLQLDMKFSALAAGLATVVAVFPFPFLSAPAGKLGDRHGSRKPVLVAPRGSGSGQHCYRYPHTCGKLFGASPGSSGLGNCPSLCDDPDRADHRQRGPFGKAGRGQWPGHHGASGWRNTWCHNGQRAAGHGSRVRFHLLGDGCSDRPVLRLWRQVIRQ